MISNSQTITLPLCQSASSQIEGCGTVVIGIFFSGPLLHACMALMGQGLGKAQLGMQFLIMDLAQLPYYMLFLGSEEMIMQMWRS